LLNPGVIVEIINFIYQNMPMIAGLFLDHIKIVLFAVSGAILIGVPTGIAISLNKGLSDLVLGTATAILTIPSIALFGLLIPVLSPFGNGIGYVPAVIAVLLYSLLPIIRNTFIALRSIDPDLREAAEGIGMHSWQRLLWIELPLSVPLVMAGIRVAVVSNIGVAAIAAYIGAGGLGTLISRGLSQSDPRQLITGAIAISLLAILMDFGLLGIQRLLTPTGILPSKRVPS
jgi:osmoprotectant transport system permease protein